MSKPFLSLDIDVTEALGPELTDGARTTIDAWVFPPNQALAPEVPSTIVLLNGGSYDKRYFHFEVPGRSGYSAAEALASRGHWVILPDHLGVSGSSRLPDQKKATRHVVARANHAAVSEIYRRLECGTLDPDIPAVPSFVKAGGGHSMGGCISITQQAAFGTYDRLLVLGYTAIGVHLSIGGRAVPAERPYDEALGDYWLLDHAAIAETFHWDDVPPDVRRVDQSLAVEVPQVISQASTQMGVVAADAARIAVPVYICLGERDVSPSPPDEPGCYRASPDVTLHILPKSGHCQSFASSRMEMIDSIDKWLRRASD